MKNIRILLMLSLVVGSGIIFITCNKVKTEPLTVKTDSGNGAGNAAAREISSLELPENATEEMIRIFDDIENVDHVVSINANPNFGVYCSSCSSDIYLNGVTKTSDDVSIQINDASYTPDAEGQFLIYNSSWSGLFGTDVDIEIKSGNTSLLSTTMHVPEKCLVNQLGTNGIISRTGNTLTWESDPYNVAGHVILYYYLFGEDGSIISDDGQLIEDDGSFSIDDIISNTDVKSIYFQVSTGNTASTMVNSEKFLFMIQSIDHHRYTIQ